MLINCKIFIPEIIMSIKAVFDFMFKGEVIKIRRTSSEETQDAFVQTICFRSMLVYVRYEM